MIIYGEILVIYGLWLNLADSMFSRFFATSGRGFMKNMNICVFSGVGNCPILGILDITL